MSIQYTPYFQNVSLFSVDQALKRKDYDIMIEDKELFWRIFCCAVSQGKIQKEDAKLFSAEVYDLKLRITGRQHIIFAIQNTVERIRKFLMKHKSFTLVPLKDTGDYYLILKSDSVHKFKWNFLDKRISKYFFEPFIQPAIPLFCELLGVKCSQVSVSQHIKYPVFTYTYEKYLKNIPAFEITSQKAAS